MLRVRVNVDKTTKVPLWDFLFPLPPPNSLLKKKIKLLGTSLNSSSTQRASHLVHVKKQYLCIVCSTPLAKGMIALVFNYFIRVS